jgi:hypothetical protein
MLNKSAKEQVLDMGSKPQLRLFFEIPESASRFSEFRSETAVPQSCFSIITLREIQLLVENIGNLLRGYVGQEKYLGFGVSITSFLDLRITSLLPMQGSFNPNDSDS